jgi:pyruvate dehydrogenase E2 component (dihydrolipoamide acetyltransferase)
MLRPVFLPQLGQTMEEGTIEKWHKREGERVRKGEVLYELTTDKATLEVEAFADGILKKIVADEGQTVPVDELIAVIGDEGDQVPADLAVLAGNRPAAEAPRQTARAAGEPAPRGTGETIASPRARKVAAEKRVSLTALRGSGPGGRIIERDVLEHVKDLEGIRFTPAAAALACEQGVNLIEVAAGVGGRRVRKGDVEAAAPSGSGSGAGPGLVGERIPLSPMRRTIARRMAASKQTIPHFYLVGEVEMRAALGFLAQSAAAARPTVTGLLVKAVALALKEHPRVGGRLEGDALVLSRQCNVGVAVAVEDGVFVPVIRGADTKALSEISSELRSLAEAARAGKLIPEQYEGGSITVSNLGMYGVDYFLPIIHPPESAIVGAGMIRDQVVAREGGMRVVPVMTLSISADHRAVTGVEVARFFQSLKGLLEDPRRLAP